MKRPQPKTSTAPAEPSLSEALRLAMTFTARVTAEIRMEMILETIAASDNPKAAAEAALEELRKPNTSKKERGRPEQTTEEFEKTHQGAIAVAELKRRKGLTDAEALRQVSKQLKIEHDALRTAYYRDKKTFDSIAALFTPTRK